MDTLLNLGFIGLGTFALICITVARFIFLPQNNLSAPQVKIAINFTNAYRAGGVKKFLYFFIPISAFFLFSVFGGLALMIASWIGVSFSKRYSLMDLHGPQEPLRAAVISEG